MKLLVLATAVTLLNGWAGAETPKQRRMEAEFDALLKMEQSLPTIVNAYIAKEETKLAQLKQMAEKADTLPKEFILNPVNVFRLINRLTHSPIFRLMRENSADETLNALEPPGKENLAKAARELFRWQDKTMKSPTQIADGTPTADDLASEPLTAKDCYALGQMAFEEGDNYHCAVWMEESLRRIPDDDTSDDRFNSLDHLSHCYFKLGGNLQRTWWTIKHQLLIVDPNNKEASGNLEYLEDEMRKASLPLPTSEADLPPIQYGKKPINAPPRNI